MIFNKTLLRRRRDRAARDWNAYRFLLDQAVTALETRLLDVTRSFAKVLIIGDPTGGLAATVKNVKNPDLIIQCDLGRLAKDVQADEEFLPFADASFDLIISVLTLHWTNDLPGALLQIRRALKPDGFFLGVLLGGQTLIELRQVLMETEMGLSKGVAPRVSPSAHLADMAGLLQRAGFALPVADLDSMTVTYSDMLSLCRDLRGMGSTNALAEQAPPLTRKVLGAAMQNYKIKFHDEGNRIRASFDLLYLAGWAPAETQPKALKPGSAKSRLSVALGVEEIKLP